MDTSAFEALCADAERRAGLPLALDTEARRALGGSDFLLRRAQRDPEAFAAWLAEQPFAEPLTSDRVAQRLAGVATQVAARPLTPDRMPELQAQLRRLRGSMQQVLVWRHVTRRASFEETVGALSALADGVLELAVGWCHQLVTTSHGEPRDDAGAAQRLVVFALGKLGGQELNLSSDIDLICAYPSPGKTSTGHTNQQFFVRQVQLLVKLVAEVTVDGFCFRVDLRLRPFGDSGALVAHFAAMEHYYESSGRDWERYALIKARPCAGDVAAGADLLQRLQPFVYRRYLDFAAIESLRQMRGLIRAEHQAHEGNVKLGAGGIRDVEFLAQMLQLIWGGRQPALRTASLASALAALVEARLLPAADRDALWSHYLLLRDTEHCLQALRDEQTHQLPASPEDQTRLAAFLERPDYPTLLAELNAAQQQVTGQLDRWLQDEQEEADSSLWRTARQAWLQGQLPADLQEAVSGRTARLLTEMRESAARGDVASTGRERLDTLMPLLLSELLGAPEPDAVLLRLNPLLQNVLRRSTYLVLLIENAAVREELLRLARGSDYFSDLLTRHPALLDELFLHSDSGSVPGQEALRRELAALVPPILGSAPEQAHFDALAQFKAQHQFRGLLALTRGGLSMMRLADYLTDLAEVVVATVLEWAWRAVAPAQSPLQDFVVVAYGKFGGFELGAGSDLDLVFVHDWPSSRHALLHKLVRRLLNGLSMQTYFGPLYEVDIRLRPAGRDGLLVSTLKGFADYQRKQAWLWEHQALVRARPVAGCEVLAARFDEVREEILSQQRNPAAVREEVGRMRARLAASAAQNDPAAQWKKGAGGIVDIEFMVQYLVLSHACRHPSLLRHTDNARILAEAQAAGLLPGLDADSMVSDYATLRRLSQLALVLDIATDAELAAETGALGQAVRARVQRQWRLMMEPG